MLCPSQNHVATNASRSVMIALIAAAIVYLACAPALAQVTSGTIFGTVKDPTGAVVNDAAVTISNPATGLTRHVTTSADGAFVAPNLLPGTYTITVEAKGFKKVETTGVVLSAADKLNVGDIVLTMGAATESVNVTADVGQIQLQSNSGERSDLITSKQLNDVAMNGRNVLDYLKLVPGVTGLPDLHQSGTGSLDAFNINGTRANQHEFTLDGASNVDTGNNGGTHVTLNTDSIEEVKILTSNYQAEFGKAAGGQIAITTKSGNNQWHGNGRFFHRHEGLNANEYFNKTNELSGGLKNAPPLYRYNDVGYQIGGPLKKDKLFVFWSQEFFHQLVPVGGTTQFYTPTDLERNGDFSQSTDGNGNPVTISGPGITNNVINRDQLPSSLQPIFDQMKRILSVYPEPNVNGFGVNGQNYNYSQFLSAEAPRREDVLRVDFQLNSKNRLYGRWIHNTENDSSPFLPFPGPYGIFACSSVVNFPGGCTQKHPGWNFSANLISTITPTLLNEVSVGPSHTYSLADGAGGNISRGKNGIDLQLLYPLANDQVIPDISFNGLNNVNFQGGYLGATPWHQANTTINVNDNLTWVRHNHTLKAGMFYQRNRKDQIAWGNINGQFQFNTGVFDGYTLGDPLASALLGYFSPAGGSPGFQQSTARPTGYFRYNQLEFYVQDTWRATSRLTLDYGMRFAWIPPQTDARNQVALFDPASYDPDTAVSIDSGGNIVPDSGDPLDGMRYANQGQIPKGAWDSRGIMPEPRFGFAYDVFSNHKTVLRGGFGMMHDRVQGNLIYNTVFNNPAVVQTGQVSAGNIADLPTISATFPNSVQSDKNIIGAAKDGKVPTVYSFSLGVQHEIARGTTLDIAYVGTLSRHLVTSSDINAVPYGYAFTYAAQDPANYAPYCAQPGSNCDSNGIPPVEPALPPIYAAAGYSYSGAYAKGHPSYTDHALVPYKGYGQIAYLNWDGTANYNSLQVSLQRRFGRGLTLGAVYTWSKSLTTSTADQDYQDPFNVRGLDYRAASWDRTHVAAFNYVYDIPGATKHFGGPKWLSYITDNYQLSGVTNFMTGAPVDMSNFWQGEPGAQTGGNMWAAIPNYYTLDNAGNPIYPTMGAPIRGSRDILRNGGLQNWDVSLFKNIPLGTSERYSIQLRLEAFNVFNHPNFSDKNYGFSENGPFQWNYPSVPGDIIPDWCGVPGTCVPDFSISRNSNWGTYSDTYNRDGGPGGFRVLQLGAKFYF
jgi:hypothetical protein